MLYRLLLTGVISLGLSGCFWDDYEESRTISTIDPPANDNETLPDTGAVVNGNLEDSDTQAVGWTTFASAGSATFSLSGDQYYSGERSLKASIQAVGANLEDIGVGPTEVEVEVGIYYFSGWVLGTNGATATFAAHPTGNPDNVLGSETVEVRSIWQRVTFEVSVPPGVTSVDLPVYLSDELNLGADFYFDSFALKGGGSDIIDVPIGPDLLGWSTDGTATAIAYDEELGVVITPGAGLTTQVVMYTLAEPIDPRGLTLTYVLNIPQEYKDAGINVLPYVQEEGGSYSGHWGYIGNDQLEAGGNVISYVPPADAPEAIQRIGLQIQGGVSGLEDITGISISRIYYPGADGDSGPDLPLDAGWSATNGSVVYTGSGVSYSPAAGDDALTYMIDGPDSLEGATIVYTLEIDQDFVDSGANLQPFAQQAFGDEQGEWNCWFGNDMLTVGTGEYACTLDEAGAPFNLGEGQQLRVGFQAKGSPAGTVTIKDLRINYPGLPVDAGWRTQLNDAPGTEPVYDEGVQYSPTAEEHALLTDASGPANYEGATFVFTIEASQEFIDSGANLQPIAQAKVGSWPGEWGCWINNSDLRTDGAEHSCVLQAAEFNLQEGQELQIGVQPVGATPAGTVTITNVRIIFAD